MQAHSGVAVVVVPTNPLRDSFSVQQPLVRVHDRSWAAWSARRRRYSELTSCGVASARRNSPASRTPGTASVGPQNGSEQLALTAPGKTSHVQAES